MSTLLENDSSIVEAKVKHVEPPKRDPINFFAPKLLTLEHTKKHVTEVGVDSNAASEIENGIKAPTENATTTSTASNSPCETSVDYINNVVIKCSDDVEVLVPRSSFVKLPFGSAARDVKEFIFKYPSNVLNAVYYWCEFYGKDGVSSYMFPTVVPYYEFSALLQSIKTVKGKECFEIQFYNQVLHEVNVFKNDASTTIMAINCAKEYGMTGLLDFCVVALGCAMRKQAPYEVSSVLFGQQCLDFAESTAEEGALPPDSITKEEYKIVDAEYPWLRQAVKSREY